MMTIHFFKLVSSDQISSLFLTIMQHNKASYNWRAIVRLRLTGIPLNSKQPQRYPKILNTSIESLVKSSMSPHYECALKW